MRATCEVKQCPIILKTQKLRYKPTILHTILYTNCALLGYYPESSGNFLPTLRDNPSVASSGAEDGIDSLSRNVGKKLPLLAA